MVGGAVSGGLDSCTVTHWLRSKGFRVQGFTVDLGQPDEENLDAVKDRMIACGAEDAVIIPGRGPLAEAGLTVIQSPARCEGGSWNRDATSNAPEMLLSIKFSRPSVTSMFLMKPSTWLTACSRFAKRHASLPMPA